MVFSILRSTLLLHPVKTKFNAIPTVKRLILLFINTRYKDSKENEGAFLNSFLPASKMGWCGPIILIEKKIGASEQVEINCSVGVKIGECLDAE